MNRMKKYESLGASARIPHLTSIRIVSVICCVFLVFLFSFQKKDVSVFCIGDSTMSFYDVDAMSKKYGGSNYPLRGWAMALPAYLNDKTEVRNEAKSGRSSKSFISEGYWDKVKNEIRKGDFIIIQFGHNDEKWDDPKRYTKPHGEFKENLIRYVKESETLGARPILVTPIARRRFNSEGKLIDTHGEYVNATRDVAKESGVPLIDLNKMTMDYLRKLGAENSKNLFLHIKPGEFKNLPNGKTDNTHLSIRGACEIANLFMEGVSRSGSALNDYQSTNKGDCLSDIN